MKNLPLTKILTRLILALLLPVGLWATEKTEAEEAEPTGCSCSVAAPTEAEAESWAIRGVIESVLSERDALLVKHEEIPGFMRAMTMMFQVDPALLPKVKSGDNLTATMKRAEGGGWLLEDVEIVDS